MMQDVQIRKGTLTLSYVIIMFLHVSYLKLPCLTLFYKELLYKARTHMEKITSNSGHLRLHDALKSQDSTSKNVAIVCTCSTDFNIYQKLKRLQQLREALPTNVFLQIPTSTPHIDARDGTIESWPTLGVFTETMYTEFLKESGSSDALTTDHLKPIKHRVYNSFQDSWTVVLHMHLYSTSQHSATGLDAQSHRRDPIPR